MIANNTIRPFFTGLLLLLFVFSITPRQYLHDLFADHEDLVVTVVADGEAQLSAAGFQCNTHEQVAESPFVNYTLHYQFTSPVLFPAATTQHLLTSIRLQGIATTSLRGPPANS